MSEHPILTDRAALMRNRHRAQRGQAALFLHHEAAAEIQERLSQVNKTFRKPAIVTAFPEVWENLLPNAVVVADTDRLPLGPGAHDLVIHAMALHWANDPVGQLIQSFRALTPDGLFLAAFPGGRTLHELRTCLAEAESRLVGGLSPRVLPMGEIRDLGGLLQRAGFALPVADSVSLTASYRDLFHLAADLRAMGETNALMSRPRRIAPRQLFDEAGRIMAANYPAPDRRVTATYELIFLTGWSPDPSQQKPLKPGSAKARLVDALKPGG